MADRGHMPGLDGIRALAVTAVVWHHTHPGYSWLPMSTRGFLGVDVFFVLSGFLITTLLLREQQVNGKISLWRFYVRRTLRIFPLYYTVLLMFSAYFWANPDSSQAAAFFSNLPFHATYTSNWISSRDLLEITWSLSAEEQFYLIWPPLFLVLGARSIWFLLAFLLVNEAVNFGFADGVLHRMGMPYSEHIMLQATFAPIVIGVLTAFVLKNQGPKLKPMLSAPVATGAILILLVAANIPGDVRGWPRLVVHVSMAVILMCIVSKPEMPIVRGLEWRPIAYIGVVSYGIYLLHKIGIHVVNFVVGRWSGESPAGYPYPGLMFFASMCLTLVLAAVSYRYLESPILRLKPRADSVSLKQQSVIAGDR